TPPRGCPTGFSGEATARTGVPLRGADPRVFAEAGPLRRAALRAPGEAAGGARGAARTCPRAGGPSSSSPRRGARPASPPAPPPPGRGRAAPLGEPALLQAVHHPRRVGGVAGPGLGELAHGAPLRGVHERRERPHVVGGEAQALEDAVALRTREHEEVEEEP